jgi:ketosteroid isomerase-like protein
MEPAEDTATASFAGEVEEAAHAWTDAAFQGDLAACASILADDFTRADREPA